MIEDFERHWNETGRRRPRLASPVVWIFLGLMAFGTVLDLLMVLAGVL